MENDRRLRNAFETDCKRLGWKCTIQRFAVYCAVQGNTEHPSVDMACQRVQKMLPGISADSVYRILNDFSAAGLIRRMDGLSCVRFDCNTEKHAHFICAQCGKIADFPPHTRFALPAITESFGNMRDIELRLIGICHDCAHGTHNKSA